MEQQTQISREDFSKFLGCLEFLQDSCVDCEIYQGKIRQTTDDRLCFFEIDISDLIGNLDILFPQLKVKVNSLKTFEVDNDFVDGIGEEVSFESDDKMYYFSDPFTKMKFRMGQRQWLENKYMTDEEKQKRTNDVNEDNLLLSVDMSSYIAGRISKLCDSFNNDIITCKVKDNSAFLELSSNNHDNSANFTNGIEVHDDVPNCKFDLNYLPFSLKVSSDINMRVYKKQEGIVLLQCDLKYYNSPVSIFSQCRIGELK